MKFLKFINSNSIEMLFFIPASLGFVIAIIGLILSRFFMFQSWIDSVLVFIVGTFWSSSGLFIIIKKESPPPWYSKGSAAILHGITILLGGAFLASLGLRGLFK